MILNLTEPFAGRPPSTSPLVQWGRCTWVPLRRRHVCRVWGWGTCVRVTPKRALLLRCAPLWPLYARREANGAL